MDDVGRAFLDRSGRFLSGELMPRVSGAVADLDPGGLWWRPNEASNAVGNLLLHMSGNLRQWVVHGVGGAEDVREREREFAARDGPGAAELVDRLEATVREAVQTLDRTEAARLLEPLVIQGMDVSVLHAVYHAVEHFSMHTGQILWIVKLRTGRDLGFYRVDDGIAESTW